MAKIKISSDLKEELIENLYLKTNIINIDEVYKLEKEFVSSNIYLPNLIRYFISNDYYSNVTSQEVVDKLVETRRYTRQENVEEFIEWIKKNPQYDQLLNNDELKKLNQHLKKYKRL